MTGNRSIIRVGIDNLEITGGQLGQVLTSDGDGNISWQTFIGGTTGFTGSRGQMEPRSLF